MEKLKFRDAFINSLIPIAITMFIQLIVTYTDAYSAKIEIISSLNENGIYHNVLSIKSYKKSDYLNDIVFENHLFKEDDFQIEEGKAKVSDSKIVVSEVSPNETISVTFDSFEELNENNLKIIYSDKKVLIEFFNQTSDVLSQTIYTILINAIIYFLIMLGIMYIAYKAMNKDLAKLDDKMASCDDKTLELTEEAKVNTQKVNDLEREMFEQDLFYRATIEDVKKENEFYKSLLTSLVKEDDNKLENIEEIVKKELNIFKDEDCKFNSYGVVRFLADRLNKNKE